MRLIDPTRTRITVQETEHGRNVQRVEHHDGSVDVNVKIKAVKLHLTADAPPNALVVAAVAELEAATREHRLAKHSGSPKWAAYARRRVEEANLALLRVQ